MPELCEHNCDWQSCQTCIDNDLALADAIDTFVAGLKRERHEWWGDSNVGR